MVTLDAPARTPAPTPNARTRPRLVAASATARSLARRWVLSASLVAATGIACSGLPAAPAARMAVPEGLAAVEPMSMGRLPRIRQGEFEWMAHRGRFERQADRLSLFDTALEFDKLGLRYSLGAPADRSVQAQCRGRRTGAAIGIVAVTPRPLEVQCTYSGAFAGTLSLSETAEAAGTRTVRRGRLQGPGVALDVSSVHRVEGSPLPLASPIGYTFADSGRVVGALEVNGSTPRLWIDSALTTPASASPSGAADGTGADAALVREALLHLTLTLALLWDPALAQP